MSEVRCQICSAELANVVSPFCRDHVACNYRARLRLGIPEGIARRERARDRKRYRRAHGGTAVSDGLPVMPTGPMIRDARRAVKDKSYQRYPVGAEVGRYLRALRFSGAAKNTIDTYELVLAKLAIEHDDFESLERFSPSVGTTCLREFLETHWGDLAPATRRNRLAAVRSFFKWAREEGRISADPTLPIKGPRARNVERLAYPRDSILSLISAQETLRDVCALWLLARLALRKDGLRRLHIRDIDLVRNLVFVRHGKGDKAAAVPIAYRQVRDDLYLHVVGEGRRPEEFLLYPKADREHPMQPSSVHRWFKRCLARAGLPATVKLHELRHTAGDEMWRETGNIVLAQKLLRHESVGTTEAYLHPTREDLVAGMRLVDERWSGS